MRALLARTAIRLFAERGFDQVTVADIASDANVSEKTVFNYFATKEDLMLSGRAESEADLIRAVRERGPGQSVLSAVRAHVLVVAERIDALPAEKRAAFRKVVKSTPAVQARLRQMSLAHEEELARVLAKELGTAGSDPVARVVASAMGLLGRLGTCGITGWPDGHDRSHAENVANIHLAFDLFERGLGHYGVRGKR
ncbi:MAG TPA: TetR/AcrR family transcriptional regulator [Polyangiaceae bacterium]|nr:TetR/AcrR family transcriptional regulator [Polyangiaceae bacterium]